MSSLRARLLPAGFVRPCLPSPAAVPPAGPDWIHEIKYDGYRMMARRDGVHIRLLSRTGTDWSAKLPLLLKAVARLACTSCLIDGEVVAHNEDGVPDFKALRKREPPSLVAFDLLERDGRELRREPIEVRRQELQNLIAGHDPAILYSAEIGAPADLAFVEICKMGLEGIISKRRGMTYESGRSQRWVMTVNPDAPARRRLAEEDWNR
jgi:bifunctional non-homologous end joining protein LigD